MKVAAAVICMILAARHTLRTGRVCRPWPAGIFSKRYMLSMLETRKHTSLMRR